MYQLRLGIVGAGGIAAVIADAVKQVATISLVAVASRRPESAAAFAKEHEIDVVFETWQQMLSSDAIDAVYIATPTSSKEEIALFAAANHKHLLVDKPFASSESLKRMLLAASNNHLAFMDATHFSHNPRTHQIRRDMEQAIGSPLAVRSSFFFPFSDRSNIRFNPEKEPTGAVGDMAWYAMRAIAEYLQPQTAIQTIAGGIERDPETGAVIRGSGVVMFKDKTSSTFDFGYNANTCLMDLDILGSQGSIQLTDYVLDWKYCFASGNPDVVNGYTRRTGLMQPNEFEWIAANTEEPQAVSMMRNFVQFTQNPNSESAQHAKALSLKTQELVDAYWLAVR